MGGKMKLYIFSLVLILGFSTLNGDPIYEDGVLIGGGGDLPTRDAIIVDSFRSSAPGYSMGLAWDGRCLWNDDAFQRWFGKTDTLGSLIRSWTPTSGNRDMAFDGQYLWATDWQAYQVYKYDTSTCTVISSYAPPFGGHANGITWTGRYFWVGEEGGQIYQCDTNMALIRTIPARNNQGYNPRGLAFDGRDLWVGCQSPLQTIFRIDTISGTILEQFTSPCGSYQQGLSWDGRYLWATGGLNWTYKILTRVNIEERQEELFTSRTGVRVDCYPNPFKQSSAGGLFIRLSSVGQRHEATSQKQEGSLAIYDVTGKSVRFFYLTSDILHLTSVLFWDGRDARGESVAPGIFFISLKVGEDEITKKVVFLK